MAKQQVFNSFLKLLMSGKEKEEIYNKMSFDLWFCSKNINFSNDLDDRLGNYFDANNSKQILYIGNLGNMEIQNVFSEDGLPTEDCYQSSGFLNIPASAYIFSKHNYPRDCRIDQDYNYMGYDYYVEDTTLNLDSNQAIMEPENNYDITSLSAMDFYEHYVKPTWQNIGPYFKTEYGFTSGYDDKEYSIYNIEKLPLVEDQFNVYSNNTKFDIQSTNIIGGAFLVTWYDGERANVYNDNGKEVLEELNQVTKQKNPLIYANKPTEPQNSILVSYTELPKTFNLNKMSMNIQWSENGLFSIK